MEEVTRRFKINGYKEKTYPIYTQEEADEQGITYTPDFTVAEPGDWVLSSDGWVFQMLDKKRYLPRRPSGKHLNTYTVDSLYPHCRTMHREHVDTGVITCRGTLRYEPWKREHRERKKNKVAYGTQSPMDWTDSMLRRRKVRDAIRYVAMLTIQKKGMPLTDEEYAMAGRMFRPDKQIPEANAKKLFKQPKVRREVAKEIASILTGVGVRPEDVINMYLEALDLARRNEQTNNIIAVADRFSKLHDLENMREKKGAISDDDAYLDAHYEDIQGELDAYDERTSEDG